MKHSPSHQSRSAADVRLVIGLLLLISLPLIIATQPRWWTDSLTVDEYQEPIDYAAVNSGQLKNFAVNAYDHFQKEIPSVLGGLGSMSGPTNPNGSTMTERLGGTGYRLRNLVEGWVQLDNATGAVLRDPYGRILKQNDPTKIQGAPQDFTAVNVGQIKAVAAPFYDRLAEIYANHGGYPTPWSASGTGNFAMANVGQIKNTFRFDLQRDFDGDRIPDLVELQYGLSPTNPADAATLRTVNGIEDGLTWEEAFSQRSLDTLGPLVALKSLRDVVLGDEVSIALGASGGRPPYVFALGSMHSRLHLLGTLGPVLPGNTVTFSAGSVSQGVTWFDYTVTDSLGQTATATVAISIFIPAFEIRRVSAGNAGGMYEQTTVTTTKTGSWDTSMLSAADPSLNTEKPLWSGWTTETAEFTQTGGTVDPYDPADTPSAAEFMALEYLDPWVQAMGLPIGAASGLYYDGGVAPGITSHFANPSTSYPYFEIDEDGIVTYRLPGPMESASLTDSMEEVFPAIGRVTTWSAEKVEVRMVRPSRVSTSRPIHITLPKISWVNGNVTPAGDVSFVIAPGQTHSNTVEIIAYTAGTGSARSVGTSIASPSGPEIVGNYVDRDEATAPWSAHEPLLKEKPLYSGKGTGDMVEFILTDASTNDHVAWRAEGPAGSGILVTGPQDSINWKIYEGGATPGDATHLDWKPGNYTIRCTLTRENGTIEQLTRQVDVGFRTEDLVIVGQIVPTETHSISGSRPLTINFEFIADIIWLRNLVFVIQVVVNAPIGAIIAATPNALYVQAWALYYSKVGRVENNILAGLDSDEKAWVIQTLLNISPDEQRLPNEGPVQMTAEELTAAFRARGEYRVYSRFVAKGLIKENGAIDKPQVVRADSDIGQTKISAGLDKGMLWDFTFFGIRYRSPRLASRLTKEPAEPNRNNGFHHSSDRQSYASYAGGRIGEGGRKVHWHLLLKDAPWIFAEIQFRSRGPREFPDWRIFTSVDKTVAPGANGGPIVVNGDHPFNNLSVFKRDFVDAFKRYTRISVMPMEGHVKYFIESGSPNWFAAPPSPNTN